MKKCEALECDVSAREAELAKGRQSAEEARVKVQGALQEIQEAKKIAAGKAFSMRSKVCEDEVFLTNPDLEFSRGVCRSAAQCVRRCGVLPSRRGELNGEAVLVTISCARTSSAL